MDRCALVRKFRYDAKTGIFYHRRSGKMAGTRTKAGYIRLYWAGKFYYAHRLAWAYCYGWMPEQVDHETELRTTTAFQTYATLMPHQTARILRRLGHTIRLAYSARSCWVGGFALG